MSEDKPDKDYKDCIDSAIRKMGKNCMVCGDLSCEYSHNEKKRTKWCEDSRTIHADEYFDCFKGNRE